MSAELINYINKDSSPVKVRRFTVDFGAQGVNTLTTEKFAKDSLILGLHLKVTEACTSGGSATVTFGFTGASMITSAITKGTLVEDYETAISGGSTAYLVTAADDTFDVTVGAAACTAGQAEITVWYMDLTVPTVHVGSAYTGTA